MLSDDSTSDSDSGIRFKTDSTRRQDANPDAPDARNKERDNRKGSGSERPFASSRGRFGRRSPPKPRERSPFRERNRIAGERYSRDDRGKDVDYQRYRGSSRDRERTRDHHNDSSKPRGETSSRNGTKNDTRTNNSRHEEDRSRREVRRDYERDKNDAFVDNAESDRKKNDSRKEADGSSSRQKDPKERIRKEISLEEVQDARSSIDRHRSSRESTEKGEKGSSLSKQHDSENARSHQSDKEKPREISVPESNTSKARARSPIRFKRSPSPQMQTVREETSKINKEKTKITHKSPSKVTSKYPSKNKVQKYESDKKLEPSVTAPDAPCESDHELSDAEPKPVSYYSMVSDNFKVAKEESPPKQAAEEPIAVSDDSEDDVALRKQLLLLRKELKKTKKKAKHKEKKSKKSHKKSKTSKSGSDTMSNSEKSDLKNESVVIDEALTRVTVTSSKSSIVERRVISTNNGSSPRLKKSEDSDEEGEIVSDAEEKNVDTSDLRLRLGRQIGPMLPSVAQAKSKSADLREKLLARGTESPVMSASHRQKDDDAMVEGPALPPHLVKSKTLGPSLSSDMRERLNRSPSVSDDDVVGPLPAGAQLSHAQRKLEERALQMRIGALEGSTADDGKDAREEWMLELPEVSASKLGLGPRQFRAKAGPDLSDRSSWTDTPEQKALKAAGVPARSEQSVKEDLRKDAEHQFIQQRDAEQELAAKKHKKKHKRDESLVEIHQKKLEKKKRKEERESGHAVRRPFDRDIDLKANKFDEAQKKSIMKKAQLLDTRFSSGQSKFL